MEIPLNERMSLVDEPKETIKAPTDEDFAVGIESYVHDDTMPPDTRRRLLWFLLCSMDNPNADIYSKIPAPTAIGNGEQVKKLNFTCLS